MQALGWRGRTVNDHRRKALRVLPIDYLAICATLSKQYALKKTFDLRPPLPELVEVKVEPRPYQTDALQAWKAAG